MNSNDSYGKIGIFCGHLVQCRPRHVVEIPRIPYMSVGASHFTVGIEGVPKHGENTRTVRQRRKEDIFKKAWYNVVQAILAAMALCLQPVPQ